MPTEMEDYLFDLRGYIVLQGALDGDHVRELNAIIDELLPIAPGAWKGHMHRMEGRGLNDNNFFVQNMYGAGEPFERLIDQPAWMEHMTRFVGGRRRPLHRRRLHQHSATERGAGPAFGGAQAAHSDAVPVSQQYVSVRSGKCVDGADRNR